MSDADIKRLVEGGAPIGNQHVIQLLEMALVEAKQGRISGCAIVKENAGKMTAQLAGNLTAGIYFGLDLIKDTLKSQLTGGGRGAGGVLRLNG